MKLSIKNTLRLTLLTTTVAVNRFINRGVEATANGVSRVAVAITSGIETLNDKTLRALDSRLDKGWEIRIEEIARINREAEQAVNRMQAAIDNMPQTVEARQAAVRAATNKILA